MKSALAIVLLVFTAYAVRRTGDGYRRYQRQVPMLVPWRRPAR